MRRRLYFMLPDVATARTILNELLLARIEASHIHFLSRRDALPDDLPEATFLQKTDFVHALENGGLVGGFVGAAVGVLVWLYPPEGIAPQLVVVLVAALIGAFLGAWFASLVGSAVPNSALRAFQEGMEHGKVLLIVDVPFRRVEEIHELVASHHPEAEWAGVDPQTPAFP